MSTAILVRLTPDLHNAVRLAVTDREDMGVADYVRSATILQLARDGVIELQEYDDSSEGVEP